MPRVLSSPTMWAAALCVTVPLGLTASELFQGEPAYVRAHVHVVRRKHADDRKY